jgi:hypothetical protein
MPYLVVAAGKHQSDTMTQADAIRCQSSLPEIIGFVRIKLFLEPEAMGNCDASLDNRKCHLVLYLRLIVSTAALKQQNTISYCLSRYGARM